MHSTHFFKKNKYNIEIPVFMKNAAMTPSAIQRSGFESHSLQKLD